ncbi:MAG TPA: adenylate/guanylate cyclase domain-containing protein [Acidimicrobiia bacterium]|nr:adenylate/guanylate cyclase domain-containing protein [Acidimicrobiia bacterium]
MKALPSGTVTFMFTDIEGSTRLNDTLGVEVYRALLEQHNSIIRSQIAAHDGTEVATEGDSFFAVFVDAMASVEAAVGIASALGAASWPGGEAPRVRIGLHTGQGVVGAENYVGIDVNKANRVATAGHGGQLLLSRATYEIVETGLSPTLSVVSLGKYRLRGFQEPESIYQLMAAGMPAAFPPLRARRAASQLPAQMSDFIGREREVAAGMDLLEQSRLVTLTGPGGTGKTRLALEIGRRLEDSFSNGAVFVPLASVRDTENIASAILDALALQSAVNSDAAEHVAGYLEGKEMLLILDNFEQLVDGAAFVSALLDRAPELKVLVTSRIPLHLGAERELPIPPLHVPSEGESLAKVGSAEGVQLFVKRAAAVRPDFSLGEDNIETVATITRSLDGLPLAIELAASKVRSLTPEAILERLGNQLLSSSSPDLPARQQTIVNAIGWSYDLLDPDTRMLFEELAVFTGGFGLTEAEKLCTGGIDVLDGLSRLVDQSLLRQTEARGEPRFRMLTVIREFAYGALVARSAEREVLDRHAEVFLPIAEAAAREILTSRQGHWLRRLTDDQDNLRAALDHVISVGNGEVACRFVAALWRFWQIKGQLAEGVGYTESALAIAGDVAPVTRARALTALGGLVYWGGDWDRTTAPYREALDLFRANGNTVEVADALYNLSFPLGYTGQHDQATTLLRESLEISERNLDFVGLGHAYWGLGNVAAAREDWDEVIKQCGRSAEIFSDIDAPFDLGWARFMVAHGHLKKGEWAEGRVALRLASDLFSGVGDLSALALILDSASVLALALAQRHKAAFLAGAAYRIKFDTGVKIGEVDINQWPEAVEFLSDLDTECQAAYDEGYVADRSDVIVELRELLD